MKKALRKLLDALYFLLCAAPVSLLAGYALMGEGARLTLITALTVPVAYILALLPGRIGGSKKPREAFVERSGVRSDPDPDRNLRRDTHDDEKKSAAFPLRAVVCVVIAVVAALWLFFGSVPGLSELGWLRRLPASLIPAFTLPLALRFCVAGSGDDSRSMAWGVAIYLFAGIAAAFIHSDSLNALLVAGGSVFLALSLWRLNDQAMRVGAASRAGVKPPAAMRRRNRQILTALMLLAALVALFDWLREKVSWLAQSVAHAVGRAMLFLSGLFAGEETGMSGGGSGEADLSGLAGAAEEPSKFWEVMTYFAYAMAAVILVLLLFLFARKLVALFRLLAARVSAYFKRFTQSVSEDYQDEQESLMDWGEVQREMSESLKKRLAKLFQRDKKWEQLTPRERARRLVQTLYRRAGVSAGSRTLRETMPELKTGNPELLAAVYEQARYADRDPDGAALEALRRDEGL